MLIEHGDPDEAIRELTEALRLDPNDDVAYSMLARAYWDKAAWGQAIEAADKAIAIKPSNAQAHLWKADALRQLAAASTDRTVQVSLYADARTNYRKFLDLTNFSTGLGAKLAFHFIGLGVGSRKHADRQGAYDSLRSSGFLGLCLSEQKVGNPLKARDYCKRALGHAPERSDRPLPARQRQSRSVQRAAGLRLPESRAHQLPEDAGDQPDLDESKNAKNYVGQIDGLLPRAGCGA